MSSAADRDPVIVARGERLRRARIAAGYEQPIEAIKAHGFNENSYYIHENGRGAFSFKYASKVYGPAFGVSPQWLYNGDGPMRLRQEAPVVGYVGAGGLGEFDDSFAQGAGFDQLGAPELGGRIGLILKGDSMKPFAFDGDIAIFGPKVEDPRAMIGERVMAKLRTGGTLFKMLAKSPKRGRFNLESINPEYDVISDVELDWVLPLEWIKVKRGRR